MRVTQNETIYHHYPSPLHFHFTSPSILLQIFERIANVNTQYKDGHISADEFKASSLALSEQLLTFVENLQQQSELLLAKKENILKMMSDLAELASGTDNDTNTSAPTSETRALYAQLSVLLQKTELENKTTVCFPFNILSLLYLAFLNHFCRQTVSLLQTECLEPFLRMLDNNCYYVTLLFHGDFAFLSKIQRFLCFPLTENEK